MITQDRLKDLMTYDPDTGEFRWRRGRFGAKAGKRAGHTDVRGYVTLRLDYKKYYAHRMAWLYMTGEHPIDIDHANMDKSDNRFVNLRTATRSQNMVNTRRRSDSKTGFKGVSQLPGGRFRAVLSIDGRPCHLGTFATAEEASAFRTKEAERLYGEFYRPE